MKKTDSLVTSCLLRKITPTDAKRLIIFKKEYRLPYTKIFLFCFRAFHSNCKEIEDLREENEELKTMLFDLRENLIKKIDAEEVIAKLLSKT